MSILSTVKASLGAVAAGALIGALILACAAAVRPAPGTPAVPETPGVVLGVFDSRAVAIAWAHTDEFRTYMDGLFRELAEAKAAGDAARVAELEAFGPALQRTLHEQGFSTGPVDDILEHVRDRLPDIAAQAGVDAIVSKWDLVWRAPSAETVDVTDVLCGAFEPDEETWESIHAIVATEPVPLDQLVDDD